MNLDIFLRRFPWKPTWEGPKGFCCHSTTSEQNHVQMTLQNRRFFSFLTLPCDTQSCWQGCLATDGRVLQGSRLPKSGVSRTWGSGILTTAVVRHYFLGVSAWPAFFVSEDRIAFATDFCNTPPPKVGLHGFVLHSGHFLRWLGPTLRTMRQNLNVWAQGLFPSYCMLLKLETNLSIVWEPHIAPDLSFQIPSTRMNPSNNYELSD